MTASISSAPHSFFVHSNTKSFVQKPTDNVHIEKGRLVVSSLMKFFNFVFYIYLTYVSLFHLAAFVPSGYFSGISVRRDPTGARFQGRGGSPHATEKCLKNEIQCD